MTPGEHFVYESCCPLPVPTGTMGGFFTFRRRDGSTFNATVPTMRFGLPEMITEETLNALRDELAAFRKSQQAAPMK